MPDSVSSIGNQIAKGAAWMIGMRFAMRGIGLVSTIILARLLTPEDFGVVAIATMLFGFLLMLGEFGFDTYLIKKQDADRSYYDTVWTMTVIRGLLLAAILITTAQYAADFFNEPRIQPIIYCLAGFAVVTSLYNVGVVDFRKEMTFDRDFLYMVIPKIASFAVTVICAFMWRDYWALVVGMATNYFCVLVLGYIMHPYRPRFSLIRAREILGFSIWLLLNNILGYFNLRYDEFVLGRMMGSASVGLYSVSYEVSNMPTSELVAPIRRAIFPGYAKLAVSREKLADSFVGIWSTVLLVVGPMAFGILLVADYLVPVALGAKWIEAIPLIQVLAIYGFFGVLVSNGGPIYFVLGRPQFFAGLIGISLLVKIPTLIWAVDTYGVIGAAWAATFAAGLYALLDLTTVSILLKLSIGRLFGSCWRAVVAMTIMIGAVVQLDKWIVTEPHISALAIKLVVLSLSGAAIYAGTVIGLWQLCGRPQSSAEAVVLRLLAKTLGHFGRRTMLERE